MQNIRRVLAWESPCIVPFWRVLLYAVPTAQQLVAPGHSCLTSASSQGVHLAHSGWKLLRQGWMLGLGDGFQQRSPHESARKNINHEPELYNAGFLDVFFLYQN